MKKGIKEVIKILSLTELRILPSYLSYNFVLAIIPIFTIILLIASFFSISIDSIINLIDDTIPNYISNVIINIVSSKNYTLSIGLLNIFTLYVSSRGMYAVVEASNSLYGVDKRSVTRDRLKSVIILLLLVFSLLVLILIPVLGGKLLDFLSRYNIVTNNIINMYHVFKWPITFWVIFVNVILIYIMSPSVKLKVRDVVVGAFTTTILWIIFTAIFSYYLTYFTKFDVLYGGLSSVMVLLIWIYFLSYILILGIVINTRKYNADKNR